MRLSQRVGLGLLVLVAGLALLGNNLGQDNVPLVYDGHLILRIRVAAGGQSAIQRAEIVQQRLLRVMEWQFSTDENLIPSQIHVERHKECAVIACGPLSIITVTPLDARANKTTIQDLAILWRNSLSQVLEIATITG